MIERAPYLVTAEGKLPAIQAKFMYQLTLGKMLQPEAKSVEDQIVPYLRAANVQWHRLDLTDVATMFASANEIKALRLAAGDLLVCEGGEVGRAAVLRESMAGDVIIQNSVHRARGRHGNSTRYLGYVLQYIGTAGWFDVVCNRATIAHFTVDKFGELLVPCPTPSVQERIADYLDFEVEKIERLVKAKRDLLDLLAEKRRALIANAVTRGLNPDVPMRDSGIDWLGQIPEHWQTENTRWLLKEIDDRSEDGSEELLTVSHLTGVTKRSEKDVNMFLAESNEGYKRCRAGDLVINTLWAWMGAMGVARHDGIVSPAYNVYRPVQAFDPDYLDLLVRIPMFVAEITRYSKGVWSSRMRLYPEGLYEASMPVPPLAEQTQIVRAISEQVQRMDALGDATKGTVKLLEERRTALIAQAVMGALHNAN